MAKSNGKESTAVRSADASKDVQAANEIALVGFDQGIVNKLLQTMSAGASNLATAKEDSAKAALLLVQHAEAVRVATLEAGADCDSIAQGWSRKVKTMLPALAAEKSPLVKVKNEEGKETRFTLTGYGANVNSIARGMCQFDDITSDDCESYGQAREIVMTRRAEDRSTEEVALATAKDLFRESVKSYVAAVCKTNDQGLIELEAEFMADRLGSFAEDQAAAKALEQKAEAEAERQAA